MTTLAKRSTVYLQPALRVKSIETSHSISELINNAVKQSLAEDAEALAAFTERAKEPLISFEDMLKRLKRRGQL